MNNWVEIFKALADANRLLIIDMLSCGELCACDIMEGLELTQPTISHHMKILGQVGLVSSRKEGKWTKYSLDKDVFMEISNYVKQISSNKEKCICDSVRNKSCD